MRKKTAPALPPLNAPNGIVALAQVRQRDKLQGLTSKRESVTRQLNMTPPMGAPDQIWLMQRKQLQDALDGTEAEIKRVEQLAGDDLIRAMCPEWVAGQEQPEAQPVTDNWRIEQDNWARQRTAEREQNLRAMQESLRTGQRFEGQPVEYVMGVDR